jgi:hypothetical protein
LIASLTSTALVTGPRLMDHARRFRQLDSIATSRTV